MRISKSIPPKAPSSCSQSRGTFSASFNVGEITLSFMILESRETVSQIPAGSAQSPRPTCRRDEGGTSSESAKWAAEYRTRVLCSEGAANQLLARRLSRDSSDVRKVVRLRGQFQFLLAESYRTIRHKNDDSWIDRMAKPYIRKSHVIGKRNED